MNATSLPNQIQKQPGKFKTAMQKTGKLANKFLRYSLLSGAVAVSLFTPSKSLSQEPSYLMSVYLNERSHVQQKDYYSDEFKKLLPLMVKEGIFANKEQAEATMNSSNMLPYLRQILYTNDNVLKTEFANEVKYFTSSTFTDNQYSLSLSFGDWIVSYATSPTRLNDCNLSASQQIFSTPDTTVVIDNHAQAYTTWYSDIHIFEVSKIVGDYSVNLSYSVDIDAIKQFDIPDDARISVVNNSQRGPISFDYGMVALQSGEFTLDAAASVGTPYARLMLNGSSIGTNGSVYQLGIQATPNVLISDEANYYFMSTFYTLGRTQSGKLEFLSGVRLDYNINNLFVVGGIAEYNTAPSDKPADWGWWVNISIPIKTSGSPEPSR